ncbi:hypothetical protein ANN_07552 [Periplaneta americana]|uniref:Uncharacterized protein n=1 Tax=Periplaneta americana TaxID=6978 RepID=A0ABQ8T096_PERAM|nr:hypothetical protein ANN_07552 [Periplaneta americana]
MVSNSLCITPTKFPTFYTWNETQSGRGANEVPSGGMSFLEAFSFEQDVTCIRLFLTLQRAEQKHAHSTRPSFLAPKQGTPTHFRICNAFFSAGPFIFTG